MLGFVLEHNAQRGAGHITEKLLKPVVTWSKATADKIPQHGTPPELLHTN